MRETDDELIKVITFFLKLLKSEWEPLVSHHSLTTLRERKYNKVDVLPLAEDMTRLKNHNNKKVGEASQSLRENPSSVNSWTLLAKLLLARLIVLNKRREGEASKPTLYAYNNRPDWREERLSELWLV
jgi:hypothetical protein